MLSWIEINKENLRHNLAQFKNKLPDSQIWPVVKSNAYGHGIEQVVRILDKEEAASGFMVVNLDEALFLRSLTKKPIMVLSYFQLETDIVSRALREDITLPVYDVDTAKWLSVLAHSLSATAKVNIKIDSGTTRLGFTLDIAEQSIKAIQKLPSLQIVSLFTHYAESENADLDFTRRQADQFYTIARQFHISTHAACTAASLAIPEQDGDIIRLGIGLYGLWPSDSTRQRAEAMDISLKPVLSWKAKIIQIKDVQAGATIGYNRTYQLPADAKVAVLPVGYYEGYDRNLSNKSNVLIQDELRHVRGNICMNLTMVELPRDAKARAGDEVILIGHSKSKSVTVDELADVCGKINYEVVTRINSILPRIIV